jgi:diguanylate cyclase (GGDEF)-like protein/putative nucleotidyltransferase with HDIG domain
MHCELINILVIDDDPADRRMTELALKDPSQTKRFAIQMASSLAEGLESLKHQSFDLVLLDLGLPESRGLDTLENFHQECPQAPVVVLTGLQDEEAGVEAIKKGAIDYVTKPFKQDGLRTRISIALQNVELKNKLLLLANTDELTGLINRRHFFDILEREILYTKIKSDPVSVMIFDLDHFKSINDTYGHLGGDMILKQAAEILLQSIYPLDVAARYGGDEFIVLMPRTPPKKAIQAAERLRRIIYNHQWRVPNQQISITTSIGVANSDHRNSLSSHELIEDADSALYAAKRSGRNCVICYGQVNPDRIVLNPQERDFNELQNKVSSLARQLRSHAGGTVSALARATDAVIKDPYTVHHAENVRDYAIAIARQMKLSRQLTKRISTAAILMDLGKISIPNHILKKATSLTEEEQQIIRQHPVTGAQILAPIGFFEQESHIIKHHHENFDGSGYPDGLKAKEIPIGSRILAVADAFDAMTSDRAYAPARSCAYAMNEIITHADSQFDPEVIEAFQRAYQEHKADWPLSVKRCLTSPA